MSLVEPSGSLWLQLLLWVALAIAASIAFSYFLRPRTRALYPGGATRYLLALTVQAVGFLAPIPIVLVALMRQPIDNGLQVVIAVAVGFGVLVLLRMSPVTGTLLTDLHKARVAAAVERLEGKR